MTIRVIAVPDVAEEEKAVLRFRAWFRDPDMDTIICHKPGAIFDANGRQFLVGLDGVPRELGVMAAEGVTSC